MGWANLEQLMNRADVRSELLQIPLRVGHLREFAAALLSLRASLIPAVKAGGRPCTTDMREVVNLVFYVPAASRKRVAGEHFAAMSNSDPTLFERLAKVEPAKLARLLVELAAQDQTILEQVQFLLAWRYGRHR